MLKIGDRVVFGRPNGQKTTGRVVRINPKSVTVESLEERGKHDQGQKWRVAPSLLRNLDGTPVEIKLNRTPTRPYRFSEEESERRAMRRAAGY